MSFPAGTTATDCVPNAAVLRAVPVGAVTADAAAGFANRNTKPRPRIKPPTPPAAVTVLRAGPTGRTPASTPSIRLITLALWAPAWRARASAKFLRAASTSRVWFSTEATRLAYSARASARCDIRSRERLPLGCERLFAIGTESMSTCKPRMATAISLFNCSRINFSASRAAITNGCFSLRLPSSWRCESAQRRGRSFSWLTDGCDIEQAVRRRKQFLRIVLRLRRVSFNSRSFSLWVDFVRTTLGLDRLEFCDTPPWLPTSSIQAAQLGQVGADLGFERDELLVCRLKIAAGHRDGSLQFGHHALGPLVAEFLHAVLQLTAEGGDEGTGTVAIRIRARRDRTLRSCRTRRRRADACRHSRGSLRRRAAVGHWSGWR